LKLNLLKQAIWRDYQYQQLYDAAQKRMAATGTDFCVYYGLVSTNYRLRGKGQMLMANVWPSVVETYTAQNGTCIDVNTIKKFLPLCRHPVGDGGFILDHAPYADQKLSAEDGVPIFGNLVKHGSIYIVAAGSQTPKI
jgi:hypothetical protein